MIKDADGSAVLIGELKWLRKPVRVVEYIDRDAELQEGFQQLRKVREFLERFPNYLRECGVIEPGEHPPVLSYAVIARDHLSNAPQQDSIWLTEFDALMWALQNSGSLTEVIHKLQSYEWLPMEGRDFTVQFEPASIAGVTMEAETFHRP